MLGQHYDYPVTFSESVPDFGQFHGLKFNSIRWSGARFRTSTIGAVHVRFKQIGP
jgi:hypothetical protein